jgi:hypothetical protein
MQRRQWMVSAQVAMGLAATLTLASCSQGGSSLPKPGSPGFYWSSANSAYKAGDFVRTDEELQRILVSDNEFTARARVWDTVLVAGLAQGYTALADTYEAGAKANRQNPLSYRKRVSELRNLGGNMVIQLAENIHKYVESDKDPQAVMAFTFPAGSATEHPNLKRIASGLFMQDSDTAQTQTAMLQRGVVLALCRIMGNPDNTAKTLEMFQTPEVRVPRETFLFAAAKLLDETSGVFGSKQLDLPNKLKIAAQESIGALQAIPETKDTKALKEKIRKDLKKANLTI